MIATTLSLAAIEVSDQNPRRTFDERALRELAESIRAQGVLQPILVRPLARPNGRTHELVAGERRLRAAGLAGLDTIPVYVRELTDQQAAEARLVENLQRADLPPLDEARGYQVLREQGRSAAEIATAVGKSQAYVYLRLELLALPAEAQKALAAGELAVSVATLVARIPDEKARAEAAGAVLGAYNGPMGFRQAQEHILRNYTLSLAKAPFPTADDSLVPGAGTCAACPHRSGNQREMFADVKAKDVCTKPACYAAKREAAWKRTATEAQAAGIAVVGEKDARKLYPYAGGTLAPDAAYVDLDAPCAQDPKRRSWRQILKRRQVPEAVARDIEGSVHHLALRKDAMAALRDARPEIAAATDKRPDDDPAANRAEERQRAKTTGLARATAIERLVGKAQAKAFSLDAWKLVAQLVIAEIWRDAANAVLTRRGIERGEKDAPEALRTHLKAMKHEGEVRGLLLELLLSRNPGFRADLSDELKAACSVFGVDLKALLLQARKEVKAKTPKGK